MSREAPQLRAYYFRPQEDQAYRRKTYGCKLPEELAQVMDELPNQAKWIRDAITEKAKTEGLV